VLKITGTAARDDVEREGRDLLALLAPDAGEHHVIFV
jgi:hypothetical protein